LSGQVDDPKDWFLVIQQGQRDRVQRNALHEIGSPVDRIKDPLQFAVASGVPLLLAKEANLRAVVVQVLADRPFDADVDVGDHVTIALGPDSAWPLPTHDVSGQVHHLSGDRHVAVEQLGGYAVPSGPGGNPPARRDRLPDRPPRGARRHLRDGTRPALRGGHTAIFHAMAHRDAENSESGQDKITSRGAGAHVHRVLRGDRLGLQRS